MSEAKTATTGASLPNISSLLSAARQEKRVTLEQASQATKIKLEYLQKLEKGDFAFLPAPYVYAMLKEYGKALQIDPETLKRCRADLGILTDETLNATIALQESAPKSGFDNPENKKWGIIAAAALGVVLLIILIVQLFSGPSESEVIVKKAPETEQPKVAPAPEPPQAQPDSGKSQTSLPVPPTPAVTAAQAVKPIPPTQSTPVLGASTAVPQVKKILIKTKSDTSWVKVTSLDGAFVRESMVPPNQSRTYETKMGFTVSVGKAESVEIYVDGKLIPLPKNKGRVSLKVGN
ncbi:MAG: DUF4115 domain-containing protein [Chlorobiales bacterium]|nr:DUF4115 domain-containing protein [Chlorobiales bacterium]